jgi:hypothetical protein
MGKLEAKAHEAKGKAHEKAAEHGPAKDAGHHSAKATTEKMKEKKSEYL